MNDIRGLCDKHGFTLGLKAGGEVQYNPCPICERDALREAMSSKLMKLEPDTVLVYTLPKNDLDPEGMTRQMESVSGLLKRWLDECEVKKPVLILPPGTTLDQAKLDEFGMLPRLQQMVDDLDRENGELSAQCCEHLVGDDHGNPTCKYREADTRFPEPCPMFYDGKACAGVLKPVTVFHTDMGTWRGIDLNTFTETFVCSECNKTVHRSYHWEV